MTEPTVRAATGGRAAEDQLDVVIVNWNTGGRLRACLRSIERTDRSLLSVGEVVVIDNASSDGSADGLTASSLRLTVIRNPRNRGFAAACNQGAACGAGSHLLFLNPDTELYPDTLRAVGAFLRTERAADVGIIGGQMLDRAGHPGVSCSRFPTLIAAVGGATGLDRLLPAVFRPHHFRPDETRRSGPVDQVIGAFFLVDRPLFRELGGFDERYFLFYEEVDFALRARQRGRRSYFLREARIYHAGGVSTGRVPARRLACSLSSRTLFARAHWPRPRATALVVLTLTVELAARMARALLRRSPAELQETVAGYGAYLRWLLGDRREGGAPWV